MLKSAAQYILKHKYTFMYVGILIALIVMPKYRFEWELPTMVYYAAIICMVPIFIWLSDREANNVVDESNE